jgi:hypothetical protein
VADPAVELEMQLLGRAGYNSLVGTGGGGLIGLPLGSHTVLMTGFEITGNGGGQLQSWALGVPLALKVDGSRTSAAETWGGRCPTPGPSTPAGARASPSACELALV